VDRRFVPAALVVVAALADRSGAHGLAFAALIVAVPVAAAVALSAVGDLVDPVREVRGAAVHTVLGGFVALLVLTAAAARAPLAEQGVVPPLATSALVACLVVLLLQTCAGALFELKGERRSRVSRELDERLGDEERDERDGDAERDTDLKQPLRRRRAA
jgi:hypothetical protein